MTNVPLGFSRTTNALQGLEERIRALAETLASKASPELLRGWFNGRPLELLSYEASADVDLFSLQGAGTKVQDWVSERTAGRTRVRPLEALGVRRLSEFPAPILAVMFDVEPLDADIQSLFRLEVKGRLAVIIVCPEARELCEAFRISVEPLVGRVVVGTLSSPEVQEILHLASTTEWKLISAVLTRALLLELTLPRLRSVCQIEIDRISSLVSQVNTTLGEMASETSSGSPRVSLDDVTRRIQDKHTEFITTLKKPRSSVEWGLLCPADRGEPGWTDRERMEVTLNELSWADTEEEEYSDPRLRRVSKSTQQKVINSSSRMMNEYLVWSVANWNDTLRKQLTAISDWLRASYSVSVQLPFLPLDVSEVLAALNDLPSELDKLPGVPAKAVTFLGVARRVAMKGAPITAMIVTPIVFIASLLGFKNFTSVARFVSLLFVAFGFVTAIRHWRPERDFNKKELVRLLRESLKRGVRQDIKQRGDAAVALIEHHLDRHRQEIKEVLQGLLVRMQSSQTAALTAERQVLQVRKQVLEGELKTAQDLFQACTTFLKDLNLQVAGIRHQLRPPNLIAGTRRP